MEREPRGWEVFRGRVDFFREVSLFVTIPSKRTRKTSGQINDGDNCGSDRFPGLMTGRKSRNVRLNTSHPPAPAYFRCFPFVYFSSNSRMIFRVISKVEDSDSIQSRFGSGKGWAAERLYASTQRKAAGERAFAHKTSEISLLRSSLWASSSVPCSGLSPLPCRA